MGSLSSQFLEDLLDSRLEREYQPAGAARRAVRAVVVVRPAIVIVLLLLLRLVCLTSALRLAGRCTIDRIERLMAATLVRPVTTVQLGLR